MRRIERDAPPPAERTVLLELYRQMLAIRRMEEASAKAYAQGKIGGFLHLYIGQESVAVGANAALRPEDYMVATYREHGHAYIKGAPIKAILAELYGKATGISKGLGGSMHLFDKAHNFLGGYGIVGGHVPLAAGVAFASKYRDDGRVTLCFFGDGSASQGAFHEGLCLAALWHLPIVFICENNQYSMGTPLYRSLSVEDVSQKALAYGMARDRFGGEDVLLVRDRIAEAARRAREEHIPTLIEIKTYRFRGHSMSDPGQYRTKEEIDEWRKRDPVPFARERLLGMGVAEPELTSLEDEVKREVDEAVSFAEESPPASEEDMTSSTYAPTSS
jgi:pyruvate dehydrogenase E1 component alpha subunit